MKNILFLLLLMLHLSIFSQNIPNGNFEEWLVETFYEEPELFNTSNQLSYSGAGVANVTKITDAVDGDFAVRLETISTFQGEGAGTVFNGTWDADDQEVLGGYPYNQRPTSVSYHARFNTVEGDTAFVLVAFKVSGIPFGIAFDTLIGNQPDYEEFNVPISWFIPNILPDSVFIAASSSSIFNPKVGNYLELDNIVFNDVTLPCPNGSFENWVDFSNEEAPGWLSSNFFTIPVSDTSVTKSEDSYSGDYAVRLKNYPTIWEDTLGFITNGFLGPDGASGGMATDAIPEKIFGYYKYTPINNDTAIAYIALYRYNQNTQQTDTLEQQIFKMVENSEYTYFEIPINYYQLPYPDTVNISFGASNFLREETIVGLGSTLFIDEVGMTFKPVGTGERSIPVPPVVYPNPVSGMLNIAAQLKSGEKTYFMVYDAFGRLVNGIPVFQSTFQYDVHSLSPGIYFFNIIQGSDAASGSFIVK